MKQPEQSVQGQEQNIARSQSSPGRSGHMAGEEVARLQREVRELAQRRHAVILVHNYQPPEIQGIADYLGDSLGLCMRAQDADAQIILFCGVVFMAETAALLNPDKRVLIPDPAARCPMAAQLPASLIRRAKKQHPKTPVLLYVNTTAQAKAEADITCTSANMCTMLDRLHQPEVLFGPDANMAHHANTRCPTAERTRVIPIPPDGGCPVHKAITLEQVQELLRRHPKAHLLAHPECNPPVQALAHHIGSTQQMLRYARQTTAETLIIATEPDMVTRLRREIPGKTFIPANPNAICQAMKLHTLQKIKAALKQERHMVKVPQEIARRARRAIERMLET